MVPPNTDVIETKPLTLRFSDGSEHHLALERWSTEPPPEEMALLDMVVSPVLDIGCGPGRHVVELAGRGMIVLGIDTSPAAISLARGRGGSALERSVFASVPGSGRWNTALLLDGNIGIGGDPQALLARVGELISATGRILVEVDPPASETRCLPARLEHGREVSPWFPWAVVSAASIDDISRGACLVVEELIETENRWFAVLGR